jgi:hypothetical protein
LVEVLFDLEELEPAEAEEEIQKLIGPLGKVVALPKSRQIMVREMAGTLRQIRSVLERAESPDESPSQLKAFSIEYSLVKPCRVEDLLEAVQTTARLGEDC